jgi:hypothetical protein
VGDRHAEPGDQIELSRAVGPFGKVYQLLRIVCKVL